MCCFHLTIKWKIAHAAFSSATTKGVTKKMQKHWTMGSKSYLELEPQLTSYFVGIEPQETMKTFVETDIEEIMLWKFMIPRYYFAITNEREEKYKMAQMRARQARMQFYDPLVTVLNDRVSFFMRDVSGKEFYELELNENVFKNHNMQNGFIFVDFNKDFIDQVVKLKKNQESFLRVDRTGLEYTTEETHTFLPHEDRGTLIKLLLSIKNDLDSGADSEVEIPTDVMYNQVALRPSNPNAVPFGSRRRRNAFLNTPRSPNKKPLAEYPYFINSIRNGFNSLFDRKFKENNWLGEVKNPAWHLFTTKGTPFDKTRISKFFGKKTVVKYWEKDDNNGEYLIEIPMTNPAGDELGFFRSLTEGRFPNRFSA